MNNNIKLVSHRSFGFRTVKHFSRLRSITVAPIFPYRRNANHCFGDEPQIKGRGEEKPLTVTTRYDLTPKLAIMKVTFM